jgi:inhibitor of KinA
MTLFATPRLLPLGDGAVTLQFGDEVSAQANAKVQGFTRALADAVRNNTLTGVLEWVPAFASLTIHVDDASEPAAAARDAALLALAQAATPLHTSGRCWRLPGCFESEFAPDLQALADARGLTPQQVIGFITATTFRVYMLGFLPGLPYMGDLPAQCEVPRLASPRSVVPERSIAVAGRMCTVYPWASPGGWHLLGRTPVRLFDASAADEPSLLRPGDALTWARIDSERFAALERRARVGELDPAEFLEPPAERAK